MGSLRRKTIQGGGQFAIAGGACSAALGALLLARRFAPGWGLRLADPWRARTAEVTAGWAQGFHLGQFITYLLCVAMAVVAALIWTLSWHRIVSHTSVHVGIRMSVAAGAAVIVAALATSPRLGVLVAGTMVVSSWLATQASDPRAPVATARAPFAAIVVLVAETLALVWGLWLVLTPIGLGFVIPTVLVTMVVTASYVVGRFGCGTVMARATISGAPLLVLPLLGLLRAPSAGWLVLVALVSLVPATIARPRAPPQRMPPFLLVPSLWSLVAIAVIPLNMREASSINVASHEAQHLGWVNSALHGRWLGADSGTLYGILREYLLVAYCRLAGPTAEHLRIAHVLLNLSGALVFW